MSPASAGLFFRLPSGIACATQTCAPHARRHARYLGESSYQARQSGDDSACCWSISALPTPDTPRVRRFLAEFLWDPRVVEAPRWLWWLALHGVILRIRPSTQRSRLPTDLDRRGSPLLLHSRALAASVSRRAAPRSNACTVALGMTYGSPSIPAALEQLRAAGVRRLIVLPLYPQYSATTTASVFDRVTRELQRWRWVPELRFITSYHDDAGYIEASPPASTEHWRTHERTHLLFSFHGIPRRYLLAGDPYHCQCLKTARLVAAAAGAAARTNGASASNRRSAARNGCGLTPMSRCSSTRAEGRSASRSSARASPTDCLETLEEIALRNRAVFLDAGGEHYDYVPALNDRDAHVALLARADRAAHRSGWPKHPTARRRARSASVTRQRRSASWAPHADARTVPRNQPARAGDPGIAGVLRVARLRAGARSAKPGRIPYAVVTDGRLFSGCTARPRRSRR